VWEILEVDLDDWYKMYYRFDYGKKIMHLKDSRTYGEGRINPEMTIAELHLSEFQFLVTLEYLYYTDDYYSSEDPRNYWYVRWRYIDGMKPWLVIIP